MSLEQGQSCMGFLNENHTRLLLLPCSSNFPMTCLIAANPDDETIIFQLSETALDGGFRNAYSGGVFRIIECTILRNCLIELLFYRVIKRIYRVRYYFYRVIVLRFFKRFYLFGDVSSVFLHHKLTERFKRLLFTRIYQCLDIFGLIFLNDFHGYQSKLVLQMVHHQTRHATIAIHPWMYGY